MPQHKHHRDVTLTETGRQPNTTSVYDITVHYTSDSSIPNLDAEMRWLDTTPSAEDDITEHEVRLFDKKSPRNQVGSIWWRRIADQSAPGESPHCNPVLTTIDPSRIGTDVIIPPRGASHSWNAGLVRADAWTFRLEIWHESVNGFRVDVVSEQNIPSWGQWRVDVYDSSGSTIYHGLLVARARSSVIAARRKPRRKPR